MSVTRKSQKHTESVSCLWLNVKAAEPFTTGVSLHSHSYHSREYLDFIPRILGRVPAADLVRHWLEERYSDRPDKSVRYGAAFWRPPLHPNAAYDLEAGQIRSLGLDPLVAITDHDDLEACAELCAVGIDMPYSLEWTVPFRGTVFHIGVFNLPPAEARTLAAAMARCTATPTEEELRKMFTELEALPDVLLVLNHPYSNEARVERPVHVHLLTEFLRLFGSWLHAIELNGLQPAADNRRSMELAAEPELPLISGGDRHGREPNANLNLTNARSFTEFVHEVRYDRVSQVLFLPQYRDPIPARYIEFLWHAVQNYSDFTGRERWIDRIFYASEDGSATLPLSDLWPGGGPRLVRWLLGCVEFLATPRVRGTLRWALGEQGEMGA
jgi:hypothetical protein